ncbi:MAG: shikimate kinase [Alkalispirochaeta sp.]
MLSSQSIAVTGLKHVGKSTIGRSLAQALSWEFVDLDELLVRRAVHENVISPDTGDKHPIEPRIRSVYRALGSTTFGEWEAEAIREIPTTYRESDVILATGGGVCDHPESMRLITTAYRVLYLRNDPVVLYERVTSHGIPAFLDQDRPRDHFLEMARRRDVLYRTYADQIIDVAGLSIEASVARIIAHHRG